MPPDGATSAEFAKLRPSPASGIFVALRLTGRGVAPRIAEECMSWIDVVLAGITTTLLVLLADLAGTGGKYCARLAERIGIVPRKVSKLEDRRTY